MASRFQYNPQTNRWESGAPAGISGQDNPPPSWVPTVGSTYIDTVTGELKQYVGAGSPDRVIRGATTTTAPKVAPTTTAPRTPKATPTTTVPKSPTTTAKPTTTTVKPTTPTTVPKNQTGPTSQVPSKPTSPAQPSTGTPRVVTPPTDTTVSDAVTNALSGGIDPNLLSLLLGGGGGSGGSGPSAAQKTATAKKVGRQNLALAKKYYGQQQRQGQAQIDAATADLLKNMVAPKAYSNVPLVTVPPALQGLQQNLLSYGATGQQAAGQATQDQAAADMYAALARRGAEQMGQAESGYFDALKNAALQAQTAGRQGLAQTAADLQAQVMLQNLQAIINAQS